VSRKGWLLFLTLCVAWGLPYLFIRVAVRELPPPALVFLRTARLVHLPAMGVIAASLVVTAVLDTPAGIATMPSSLSAETIGSVAVLSVVCTVVAFLLFFALIREVGPARTTVITYVNPLVAVLLGVAILSEPFTLGIAVGMPLILLGSVLGTMPSLQRVPAQPDGELQAGPPAP
jgi:drug/metabolite transporter (DMT)-like permease